VLDAAADAIRLEGPVGIRIAGVMARAGMTQGGFYGHFNSKNHLVSEAIGRMFQTSTLAWLKRIVIRHPPDKALVVFVTFYLSRTHRDMRGKGCPMPALAADLPRLPRLAQASFASGVHEVTGLLADLLARSGHGDAVRLAALIVAELVGAVSLARAEPDRSRSDAMLSCSRQDLRERLRWPTPVCIETREPGAASSHFMRRFGGRT
jgi:TetR/AcrR family transcriptional regulator, transcriptional repressor for nem operon